MMTALKTSGPWAALACALAAAGAVVAEDPPALPKSYALIVSGISGDKKHYDKFWECSTSLYKALRDKCGYRDDEIVFLFEEKTKESKTVDGVSTRDGIRAAFATLAPRLRAQDRLFLFWLGHAGRHGRGVRLNLRGPDIDVQQLGELLNTLPTTNVVCVVGTPLSGYVIKHASKPGRIVVTATDALPELSETTFPYHFVRGFYDSAADANKDGFLSILELFRYANRGVEKFFKENELLRTEHALLDDIGDGRGSRDPDPGKGPEGKRAAEEGFALQTGA